MVELDQLMISTNAGKSSRFSGKGKNTPIEMNTLIQSILFLSGRIEHLPDRRKISSTKMKKILSL